ncbi:L-methionine/branched-chain amino acid transporter [Psychrobium sp. 1_MG-2023]|uniref:L-methionine/branched-chain amino acid transporter n=1 Tax=Psychrobium sp. 1_MG-2023 TaxID=3062624 RepID=UPI000C348BD5|nr:L-methionine/branched-chain amino acid transporter [Psychrobium sp. 1_MG-2023]MDP2561086.1 L-methionine/branched-chain amino acid transporter [Psychrobium sp. 1_MG-2023]PKF58375.1 L-methionine/branched-chain amino acid transporter [Alteromonadales bacterium alter-6D02]
MSQLQQSITRSQGAGLLATTLLGTGVFILPQLTVEIAGTNAMYTWLGLTLLMLPLVWVFAKLASQHPHAAGPAYFVEQAFGTIWGRLVGLLFVFAVPVGASAALMMVMEFVSVIVSLSSHGTLFIQLAFLGGLWLLNIRGAQLSAKLQFALTVCIAAIITAMLLAFAVESPSQQISTPESFSLPPIMIAAGIAFWSFLGIDALSHFSTEFKNPQQDFVPAMLIGTVVVGLLYLACAWLVLAPITEGNLTMVSLFNQLFGGGGQWVIGLLGITSGLATINMYIGGAARLCWSLSHDGILPRTLQPLNQQQVPQRAASFIIGLMLIITVIQYALNLPFELFVNWTNGVFLIIYAGCMLAALKLLSKQYRVAAYLGLFSCIAIMVGLGSHMLYALVLSSLLLPLLHKQQQKIQPN